MFNKRIKEIVRNTGDVLGSAVLRADLWRRETVEQFNARVQARIDARLAEEAREEELAKGKLSPGRLPPTRAELTYRLNCARNLTEKRRILDDAADRCLEQLKRYI